MLSSQRHDFNVSLAVLEENEIHKIAIANPKTAPYGQAAMEALKSLKLYEKVKSKLVYGESVSQTVIYATTAADIGLVAKSALFSPQMKKYIEGKHWIDVDKSLYTPIQQGMVMLKSAKENVEVKALYDFLLSVEAQNIFKNYGYDVP